MVNRTDQGSEFIMGKSLNQVVIMGNLTREPELRRAGEQDVCNFSIAINRSFMNKETNEWDEITDFVDIVAWGKLANQVSERLQKGSRALIVGRLQSSSWEQDGKNRTKVEVLASDVTFMPRPETNAETA